MGIICDAEDDGMIDNREVYVDDHVGNNDVFDLEPQVQEVRSRRRYVDEPVHSPPERYSEDSRYAERPVVMTQPLAHSYNPYL